MEPGSGRVRPATVQDADACARVYAPYVRDTAVTFETVPPTPARTAERIAAATSTHAWLVLEQDGAVTGYAYGGPWKTREAYRWTCEVSVYLGAEHRGRGGGRALYVALLERLAARGYRVAVAGMTLPNDASVALHRALEFETVGTHRAVGWKRGAWHDVAWVQRRIGPDGDGPPAPVA